MDENMVLHMQMKLCKQITFPVQQNHYCRNMILVFLMNMLQRHLYMESTCPLEGRCKEGPIVCKATLTSQNRSMVYYGSCETEFKIRYNNHKQSFKFENKKHAAELSKAVWNAKDAGETPLIEWSVVKRVPTLSMWF